MKNKLIYPFLLAIFFGLLIVSCEKDNLEVEELAILDQYISENNIDVQPTASGLYYIEEHTGTGKAPTSLYQRVTVRYTGRLLSDGTIFDQGTAEFTLGAVILGWQEGLQLMRAGGKASLIIPSAIGYGARGSGASIPPYASLIFDVELISVIDY